MRKRERELLRRIELKHQLVTITIREIRELEKQLEKPEDNEKCSSQHRG